MGYIQKSGVKKLYAYLTQDGREKIITGNTIDFQVKYFTLHDDDINYQISSRLITAATYNTLQSGFIPDITGDIDNCLPVISDATYLEKNKLVGFFEPPQPGILTATTVATCSTDGKTFDIYVSNVIGTTTQQVYWYVKTEVISFPNSTSTIQDAVVLSTSLSDDFTDFGVPKSFKATFKFSDTNLPREADSYNYTIYLVDGTNEIEIAKYVDINCSKKIIGIWEYRSEGFAPENSPNIINESILQNLSYVSDYKLSFVAVVVDNGNRRRDLNFNDDDLTNSLYSNIFDNAILLAPTDYQLTNTPAIEPTEEVFSNPNTGSYDSRCDWRITVLSYSNQQISQNHLLNFKSTSTSILSEEGGNSQAITINGPILKTTTGNYTNDYGDISAWEDNIAYSLVPNYSQIPGYVPFKGNYDIFHPTVKLFNDMNGYSGFKIRYVEKVLGVVKNSLKPEPNPNTEPSYVCYYAPNAGYRTRTTTHNFVVAVDAEGVNPSIPIKSKPNQYLGNTNGIVPDDNITYYQFSRFTRLKCPWVTFC
jgi:hypothetical protein